MFLLPSIPLVECGLDLKSNGSPAAGRGQRGEGRGRETGAPSRCERPVRKRV